jgi:hypothetical protein
MVVEISVAMQNAMCNAFVDALDTGGPAHLIILTGTAPAIGAADTGTLLADLVFSATAFDDAGAAGGNPAGTAIANAITPDTNVAGGTAGYFRIKNAAASAVHAQGTVTAVGGGGDIEFDPTNVFVATGTASITAMSVNVPVSC